MHDKSIQKAFFYILNPGREVILRSITHLFSPTQFIVSPFILFNATGVGKKVEYHQLNEVYHKENLQLFSRGTFT